MLIAKIPGSFRGSMVGLYYIEAQDNGSVSISWEGTQKVCANREVMVLIAHAILTHDINVRLEEDCGVPES